MALKIPLKAKKTRRGRGKSKYLNQVILVGNNCAGIQNKKESLKNMIDVLNPAVVFLQETKVYSKGRVQLKDFEIFESIRDHNLGGGLLTAVHKNFEPVECESENQDVLVVQCKISSYQVNLINGYGPQEADTLTEKMNFFNSFESAIVEGLLSGNLVCAQLDANSKIGMEYIHNDPNHISNNGRLLMEVVQRNDLVVVNSTDKCSGTITRVRKTTISNEQSVIDYFIVCKRFYKLILCMEVDEQRKYVMTKYSSSHGLKNIVESDHNVLICNLSVGYSKKIKTERKEILRLRDSEGLRNFHAVTSNCSSLVELSRGSSCLESDASKWFDMIKKIMHICFKKIRITNKKSLNPELSHLMKTKEQLRASCNETNQDFVEESIAVIEDEIAAIVSDEKSNIVKKHIAQLSNEHERVDRLNMWRLKQKLCPKNVEPPMGKKDSEGNLISSAKGLKDLYLQTYKHRLRKRNISIGLEEIETSRNYLFNLRLSLSISKKSNPWTKLELSTALKKLKVGKSSDSLGLINELFKPGVIGEDLLESLLVIINRCKDELTIPRLFRRTKITSLYKNKGDKSDLTNDRGVHSVTKFRSIIDKLLYNDIYADIDENMSSCNVGGRKERSIRDNLFVINAVINDSVSYQKRDIDIQFYDISQCFDSMSRMINLP